MVSVSREEAIDRARRDHGDDDDIVVMGKQYKHRGRIYHDDPECSHLRTDATVEFTRREAQNNGYGPCKVCTLEIADGRGKGTQPTDLIENVREKMADN